MNTAIKLEPFFKHPYLAEFIIELAIIGALAISIVVMAMSA